MKQSNAERRAKEIGVSVAVVKAADAEYRDKAKYSLTRAEHCRVLARLIDRIEQHFAEAAFNFVVGLDGSEGVWSAGDVRDFIVRLNPYAKRLEEKLSTAVVTSGYADGEPGHPENDFYELLNCHDEWAYTIGVLVGAKLAGASRDTLGRMAKTVSGCSWSAQVIAD